MKKLFVICLFFILGNGFAFSQNFAIDKGAMILGGTAGFTSTGSEGRSDRTNIIILNPVFDYFIVQNLFVGGSVIFTYVSTSSDGNTAYGIGPEIGYAFGKQQSSTYPFLKLGFTYMESDNISETIITIGGGLVFEIVKHIGIVALLSYNIMNTKGPSYLNYNSISSNSINLNFGIYGLLYK